MPITGIQDDISRMSRFHQLSRRLALNYSKFSDTHIKRGFFLHGEHAAWCELHMHFIACAVILCNQSPLVTNVHVLHPLKNAVHKRPHLLSHSSGYHELHAERKACHIARKSPKRILHTKARKESCILCTYSMHDDARWLTKLCYPRIFHR